MAVLSIDVGIKNLAVCVLDGPDKITFWEVFDIGGAKDTTRHLRNMAKILDENTELADINFIKTVLIEKQPSFNPRMRVIASALHMYFVMKGFRDIRSYSAKYKLQLCKSTSCYDDSTKYAKNKKTAIDTTKYCLATNPSMNATWGEKFNKAKKKDDFADSFLQGCSFYKVYQRNTREMKKPSKTTLQNGTLDPAHFAWLWNCWKQEYATINNKPTRGPMDTHLEIAIPENYTIVQFIKDKLNSTPNILERLIEMFGSLEEFCEDFETPQEQEQED